MEGAEKDEEVVLESELEELVHSAGTTWQDYVNCDRDLATTNTNEDNGEEMLLSRAKTGDSHDWSLKDGLSEDVLL